MAPTYHNMAPTQDQPPLVDPLPGPWLSLATLGLVVAGWGAVMGPHLPLWALIPGGLLLWGVTLMLAARLTRRRRARVALTGAVDAHAPALRRNLARAQRRNDYGHLVRDDTAAAVAEFLASVGLSAHDLPQAAALIRARLGQADRATAESGHGLDQIPADPAAFERFVAEALVRAGWQARVTGASGDQGTDVVAIKDGLSVGLQCKLHGQPVGNAAVQAALAGARFHGLAVAAVVTNAGYTRAARDLAAATGVVLLHVADLARPDARLCP